MPFKAGIDAGADFVMISHMTLVNVTNDKLPSSLSEKIVTELGKRVPEVKWFMENIAESYEKSIDEL